MTAILFGALSAFSWGAGDFAGGLASRKSGPYRAALYGEAFGLLLLMVAVICFPEKEIGWNDLLLSAAAGLSGSFGLLIFYQAMSVGKMSIAAPVSALFTALLPVVAGTIIDGFPLLTQLGGFVVALVAVWMIAQEKGEKSYQMHLVDLGLPLLAGLFFGLYFILTHQATQQALLWPLIISRTVGTLTVLIFMLARHDSWRLEQQTWPLIAWNGVLDVGGNAFFVLAGQGGRLDIAAVLSSLYPGVTVLLAWIILKERISHLQKLGILAALTAILLMTIEVPSGI